MPQFDALGFESRAGEGDRTPTLRALTINILGTVGADPTVRGGSRARFDDSPLGGGKGDPIPADVESATLAVVARLMRPGDYDAVLARYRTAATPQEEVRALQALSTFPDVALAERSFDLAMTEVRSQNGYFVIAGLLANPVAGQAIWRRMTEDVGRDAAAFSQERPLAPGRAHSGVLRRRRLRARGGAIPGRSSVGLGTPTGVPVD